MDGWVDSVVTSVDRRKFGTFRKALATLTLCPTMYFTTNAPQNRGERKCLRGSRGRVRR